MRKEHFLAGYKFFFAVLTAAAIIVQFITVMGRASFDPVGFFSFFTIESNIFAAIVFVVSGCWLLTGKKPSKGLAYVRGAATLYMATTGIVYSLLLSGNEEALQTTLPWVNSVLHYIFPVVVVADWFIDRPGFKLPLDRVVWWLFFPLIYLAYSLIRGQQTGWYPYPFLDPNVNSRAKVAEACLCIAVGILVLSVGVAATSKFRDESASRRAK